MGGLRMKRTCSIFVYQCVVWLLFMLFVNPSSGLVRILDTKSFFILPLIFMVSAVFFIVSVLVYYRISIKAFSVELSAVKNVLAQIGLTVLFDGIIACAVIVFLVSTKSRSSGFMDFTGMFELFFAIYDAVVFSFVTVVVAVLGAVKRKASPRAYKTAVACTVFLFLVCPAIYRGVGIWRVWQGETEYKQEKQDAEDALIEMLAAKDIALPYNTNEICSDPGIMNTGFDTNMVFIDYDSKAVGFLYLAGYEDFQSFSLTGGSLEGKGYTRQRQWDLKPPGKKLTTYYLNEENSHRTVGIQLEMEDQSVYSASDLGKREDYEGGCFLDIDRN